MVSFRQFIDELLLRMNRYDPEHHPSKSVIVLDNCQIHKDPDTLQHILDRYVLHLKCMLNLIFLSGMRYVFLPPYSPDYNPIELAFSSMKAWFRRHNDLVREHWDDEPAARRLLGEMAFTATSEKAAGWFRKCQYPVD
jgi:transposase